MKHSIEILSMHYVIGKKKFDILDNTLFMFPKWLELEKREDMKTLLFALTARHRFGLIRP